MTEIKAGQELDQAVSAALNVFYDERRVQDCPKYSTDLNAAFAAAEKIELFDYYYLMHRKERWEILEHCDAPFDGEEVFASASTAALVICAAILKLIRTWLSGVHFATSSGGTVMATSENHKDN